MKIFLVKDTSGRGYSMDYSDSELITFAETEEEAEEITAEEREEIETFAEDAEIGEEYHLHNKKIIRSR